MNKYIESEEMLTPEEAAEKLKSEGSLVDLVQNNLEDPDSLPTPLQYDSSIDPEFSENESLMEGFESAFKKSRLTEKLINGFNLRQVIQDFFRSKGGNVTEDDFDEFYELCQDGYDDWGTNVNRNGLKKSFLRNLKKITFNDYDEEVEPQEPFDISKTSKMTQDLVALYSDYVEEVNEAKTNVDAKYEEIYNVVSSVITGKSFKKHAFICGDAGVGKSSLGDTKISIRVNDIIAEEIKAYLNKKK